MLLPKGGKLYRVTRDAKFGPLPILNCPTHIFEYLLTACPRVYALGAKNNVIAIWNPLEGFWE